MYISNWADGHENEDHTNSATNRVHWPSSCQSLSWVTREERFRIIRADPKYSGHISFRLLLWREEVLCPSNLCVFLGRRHSNSWFYQLKDQFVWFCAVFRTHNSKLHIVYWTSLYVIFFYEMLLLSIVSQKEHVII